MRETAWCEDHIANRDMGSKPIETLYRLAKYYHSKGYNKNGIRDLLEKFMIASSPELNVAKWQDSLARIAKNAAKYPLIDIDVVYITRSEMETVDKLQSAQLRRLAFVILCCAKFWNTVNPKNQSWVNTPDRDMMAMANLRPSIARQNELYASLHDLGLIEFAKRVDSLNCRATFCSDHNDDVVMEITDFRNLGFQYLQYHGGNFIKCQNCGVTTKVNGKHSGGKKYCAECANAIQIQQIVSHTKRKRMHENCK